jgi:hypothetical protein
MRASLVITALVVAGCAGQPGSPPPPATYVSKSGQPMVAVNGANPADSVEAQRLADAKKHGYKLVNTDGEVLYCRTEVQTGSHVHRDSEMNCLTAAQVDDMHNQSQEAMKAFRSTAAPPQGK